MSQIPFPHLLTIPKFSNNHQFRFVQITPAQVDDLVFEAKDRRWNPKTETIELVYDCYLVKEIIEQRPARGDWTAYEAWPTYYHCRGEYIGERFESAPHENIENYWQTT